MKVILCRTQVLNSILPKIAHAKLSHDIFSFLRIFKRVVDLINGDVLIDKFHIKSDMELFFKCRRLLFCFFRIGGSYTSYTSIVTSSIWLYCAITKIYTPIFTKVVFKSCRRPVEVILNEVESR